MLKDADNDTFSCVSVCYSPELTM